MREQRCGLGETLLKAFMVEEEEAKAKEEEEEEEEGEKTLEVS